MYQYGLLGEKLSHSFSREIHEQFGRYSYELMPMSLEKLRDFLLKREFKGVNVTIPYKQEVLKHCDYIDESVKEIGAVNTIVNKNGVLYGYNTDFSGFLYMIEKNNINVLDKIVYILGSGGTCKTVTAVMRKLKAKKIVVVSRKADELLNKISYEQAIARHDAQIIVNASPKGMFPNNDDSMLDISQFSELEAVIDVIYNPLNTQLLQQAKARKITVVNGLLMLVAQAVRSAELFLNESFPAEIIDESYVKIKREMSNIVLVGMPGSGKSTIGRSIAAMVNRQFIDIDLLIEKKAMKSIPKIFDENGEKYFRNLEYEVIASVAKKTGVVISTGGGALLDQRNILHLQQNGIIVFIDRPIEKLSLGNGRPLSNNIEQIEKLYKERYDIYLSNSDIIIPNNGKLSDAAEIVRSKFNDFTN